MTESRQIASESPRATMAFVLAASFLVASSIGYAVVQGYLAGPRLQPTPRSTARLPSSPEWHSLLWIIVDGLPERVAFTRGIMPTLDRLRDRGAWGVSRAGPVTMTTSCVRTLGTGYDPPLMDVLRAFDPPPVHEDNLFQEVQERWRRPIEFSGDASWTQLFGNWAAAGFAAPDRGITDITETDEAAEQWVLANVRSNEMTIVHFVGSDHVAHATGTESVQYREKLREIDGRIARLVARADTDCEVLVMADHGATVAGNHGGGEEVARRAPFVIAGPRIRCGGPYETDHRAWAATLGYLLGAPPPFRAERGVAWDFVEAPESSRREWDARFTEMRRRALVAMGASKDDAAKATTTEELDRLRDRVSGPQPIEVAWAMLAAMLVVLALSALACAGAVAVTTRALVALALLTVAAAGLQFYLGDWKRSLIVPLIGSAFLCANLRDVRRSQALRIGVPWVLGALACALASWALCDGWRAVHDREYLRAAWPGVALVALAAPMAMARGRILRWVREGGLGLAAFAVAVSIPAVWCYWLSHRAIYGAFAAVLLAGWALRAGPSRWLRPLLPLAGLFVWAWQVHDAESVPRFPATTQTALLGAALVLPVLLRCVRAHGFLAACVFLLAAQLQRSTESKAIVDGMLLIALPVFAACSLLPRDAASRRRLLLLWGLALFRILAKDHQCVTLALCAWLIDELAESAVLSPTPTGVLVAGMVVLDLLQFHLLGSVYTLSTVDVTTGFIGTTQGLDLPRVASLVFLRYAIPLLFVALLPPPAQRTRALSLFAVCLLSRSFYLLLLFPWKHADYWWVASAAPGVIFTAFHIGLWGLLALPISLLTRRGPPSG